ncbi:MAG: 16S rRNA (cytidine(1402)-2'-O)-methyltransferase [Steroidobacteraceae bacterium]
MPQPREAAPGAGRNRGRLDIVATPIGNLRDLSPRAHEALAAADVIAAEDTRRTAQLLSAIGVQRPLLSLHAHNERERSGVLLERLARGERVALVSDAGTPLLSDPGYELVRRAVAEGHAVHAIPGPTAIAAALSVAGLATDRFCFEGFLPPRAGERGARLEALRRETRTLVLFETPHRIAESLADCARVLGADRAAAVARELTKLHETVYRGPLRELAARATTDPDMARGEITLVIAGAEPETEAGGLGDSGIDVAALERLVAAALEHLPASKAAALASAVTGVPRRQAYELAVQLAALRR